MSLFLPPHLADRLHGHTVTARRAMAGGRQGGHRSNRHGASVEFAEYRPYVPGDAPSLIDWAAYARTDRYLVKRFEEETDLTGFVALDVSQSMAWRGQGPISKLDHARYLASALLYVLAGQGDRAGLVTLCAGLRERHPAASSLAGLRPMLDVIDAVEPGGRGDLAKSLHEAAAFLPRRSLVFVISDLLQPSREALDGIRRLHHDGHDVRVLHVVDRAELDLPGSGLAQITDLETGERLEVELDEVREAYRAGVADWLEEIRRGCQGCPVDYRLCDTSALVEEALRGL
ncbi:MAG: DUF58 domain-containing protein [Planctomycetes bacterium]|nr:DUF58 domain-containing protein [Planctomycetota bacterium]